MTFNQVCRLLDVAASVSIVMMALWMLTHPVTARPILGPVIVQSGNQLNAVEAAGLTCHREAGSWVCR